MTERIKRKRRVIERSSEKLQVDAGPRPGDESEHTHPV